MLLVSIWKQILKAEILKNIHRRFFDFYNAIFIDFDCKGVYHVEQMRLVNKIPTQQLF